MTLSKSEALERVYRKCVMRDGHRLWPNNGAIRLVIHGTRRDARAVAYEAITGKRVPPYTRLAATCGEPLCCRGEHLAVIGGAFYD